MTLMDIIILGTVGLIVGAIVFSLIKNRAKSSCDVCPYR